LAAPAQAATYCVATTAPGCEERESVADALDAAASEAGTDTIRIGPHTEDGSTVGSLTVRESDQTALALRGTGQDVAVEGDVRLRDGAALRSSEVAGT